MIFLVKECYQLSWNSLTSLQFYSWPLTPPPPFHYHQSSWEAPETGIRVRRWRGWTSGVEVLGPRCVQVSEIVQGTVTQAVPACLPWPAQGKYYTQSTHTSSQWQWWWARSGVVSPIYILLVCYFTCPWWEEEQVEGQEMFSFSLQCINPSSLAGTMTMQISETLMKVIMLTCFDINMFAALTSHRMGVIASS